MEYNTIYLILTVYTVFVGLVGIYRFKLELNQGGNLFTALLTVLQTSLDFITLFGFTWWQGSQRDSDVGIAVNRSRNEPLEVPAKTGAGNAFALFFVWAAGVGLLALVWYVTGALK